MTANDGARILNKENKLTFSAGFVLHPDQFYSPSYRISPFRTEDIASNLRLPPSTASSIELDKRFRERNWCYTMSGKEGIALALAALNLKRSDCVTILTTSGNRYISGCVTREIEKFCGWSRNMEAHTKAIFVNHEFGYPHRQLVELTRFDLPIIEDACHSYLADTDKLDMGFVGDFVIFSLPKIYPIQFGGLLSYNPDFQIKGSIAQGSQSEAYISAVLSNDQNDLEQIKKLRLYNYHYLVERFSDLGCAPRFDLLKNDVPGVFLFSVPNGTELEDMKQYGWRHGIECSVFYGEEAFFIPLHQNLREEDLDYFYTVFSKFLS